MPAPPPAIGLISRLLNPRTRLDIPMRLVAADAGFFLFGPFTLLADILVTWSIMKNEDKKIT